VANHLTVEIDATERVTALAYPASVRRIGATLVLAHGAGAGQLSPFMVRFATGLSSRGLDAITFNFPYTEQRRRAPDRTEKLEACYRAVIETARAYGPFEGNALFIGGKSMGGRIATHLAAADGANIQGVVVLGYPLHPPGKPDQLRAAHLHHIRAPMLFIQGARDAFGTPIELQPVLDRLTAPVTFRVVERADHSLAVAKNANPPTDQIYEDVQDAIRAWVSDVICSHL
jgi:predicted alpha/beta-hydrolase family hydrolase